MTCPRIAIVGGIFDKPAEYTDRVRFTTETQLVDGLRAAGWDVHGMGHRAFDPAEPWDLVHVHHIGRAAVRMALSSTDARFVYTNHDGTLLGDYPVSWRRRLMSREIIGRTDAIVALSETERRSNARRFGSAVPRQAVIPNGFPSGTFHYGLPATASAEQPRPTVLFVGQLIPLKGVDVLLEAFARAEVDADLLLAYQTSALEADYRRQAVALGIADRVRFLGIQSSAELAEHYRAASVLVSSSFADAFPSVIIEALMCGTPVIATDVGAVSDILDGRHRLLRAGDIDALAAALRAQLAEPATPAEREATSVAAIERFRPETMVSAHAALYRGLLDEPGGPCRKRRASRVLYPALSTLLGRVEKRMVGRGFLE